ncbi:L-asparaginase 1 [Corallincola holothuriorum]|uniref:L-asparaginase 1 n=1 Tax=Corallincola holothuriorum TaxID=2282215 RepID=A0A368NIK4_9GAMM|nr:asparaginase [Corallincola holothuriorum]RCU50417.1 L-asparaginase 1 [Corallincola holothuriorum]
MKRRKIYIAYTGGTIGMRHSAHGYIPEPGFLQDVLQKMPEFRREEMPDFEIHAYQPLIDSSDMTPTDWQNIADDIARNYDKYDGFVVLHGTDTMAYTASALSFMLQDLDKPVVVTGSQIPLAQLRSDGRENLLDALFLAANYPIPEVSLCFNHTLFRGNRTTKVHADGFNAFGSPNFPPLLEAGIQIQLVSGEVKRPSGRPLRVQSVTSQPIGMVSLYPGISADVIANILRQPVKAMLLHSYGVGNAPQHKQMLELLKQASDQGIILVNCTQCLKGSVNMDGYATGQALRDVGVISGYDMTTEATLAKLHYLLNQALSPAQIREKMQISLRGELSKH